MENRVAVEAGWKGVLIQLMLTVCAAGVGVWARSPLMGIIGVALMGGFAVAPVLRPCERWRPLVRWAVAFAWLCSLFVPLQLLFFTDENFTLYRYTQSYFAVLAWVVASGVLLTGDAVVGDGPKIRWKVPGVACACCAGGVWLVSAYGQDLRGLFYMGLLVMLLLLLLCKAWFRLPFLAVQAVNTLLLLVVGLPLADQLRPTPQLEPKPDLAKRYYSYDVAKKDPLAFARWWNFSVYQWNLMLKDIFRPDPAHILPALMRPNSRSRLFECRIAIDNKGFRGKDIPRNKGQTYRIVAIGGSTTFGCTLAPGDKPWPRLLQEMIRRRLDLKRPVRVINAGVPSYSLVDNLHRFKKDILPLKPDMILCYHGYNGFNLLDSALPPVYGRHPPQYRERPLRLLADCEYRYRMLRYRWRLTPRTPPRPLNLANIMRSKYAQAYRTLIHIAKTNGIRLVIATFSMAVNSDSSPALVAFYRSGFPFVRWQIRANEAHNLMLNRLSAQYPSVTFLDTVPKLDGHHADFIDLVHFTQAGREQLAETFFAGIRGLLEEDLDRASSQPVRGGVSSD
jgi:lysophospholipase L1-like esterase